MAVVIIILGRVINVSFLQTALVDFLLMVSIPALFIKLYKKCLREYGFSLGNLRLGLKYSAIIFLLALPLMAYGSQLPSFKEYYPIWKPAYDSIGNLILYELAVGVLLFATEFFYRGFLLFTLAEKTRYGNIIHAIVYALAHIGKPFLEIPYSFLAGLVFGEVDLKCKSILPSFLMHFLGNITFDLLFIYFRSQGV